MLASSFILNKISHKKTKYSGLHQHFLGSQLHIIFHSFIILYLPLKKPADITLFNNRWMLSNKQQQMKIMKFLISVILSQMILSTTIIPETIQKECTQYRNSTCANDTQNTPVCGRSYSTATNNNYTSPCLACTNKEYPSTFYTLGPCPSPYPPDFLTCERSNKITRCQLLDFFPIPPPNDYCLIDDQGDPIQIEASSLCNGPCVDPRVKKYTGRSCDWVHEGKSVREWAKSLAKKPGQTVNVDSRYTPCFNDQADTCNNSKKTVCGVSSPSVQKEFDNQCLACADMNILGWKAGKCSPLNPPEIIQCSKRTSKFVTNSSSKCRVCSLGIPDMKNTDCEVDPCQDKSVFIYIQNDCENFQDWVAVGLWLIDKESQLTAEEKVRTSNQTLNKTNENTENSVPPKT